MPTKFVDLPAYVTPIIDTDKVHIIKPTGDFITSLSTIVDFILPISRSNWLNKGINSLDLQTIVTSATQVASGDDSIIIGQKSSGRSTGCVGIGRENSLEPGSNNATVLGINNQTFSQNSVLVGRDLTVRGNDFVCIGYDQQIGIGSHYGVSFGSNNVVNDGIVDTVSIGRNLVTTASSPTINIGLGNTSINGSNYSVNIGFGNIVDSSSSSICIGRDNEPRYDGVFIGESIIDFRSSPTSYSIGIGKYNFITGDRSISVGFSSFVTADRCVAVGYFSNSSGDYASSFGPYAYSSAEGSTAIGYFPTASGVNSISIGTLSTSEGESSTSIGHLSFAKKDWTRNMSGLSVVRADRLESTALGDAYCAHLYSGSDQVILSNEIDLLATSTITVPLTTGVHFFPTEVGVICLTASSAFLAPEVEFGNGVILDFLVSANFANNMSDVNKRQKYTVLNSDDGLTSLSATITQPAVGVDATGRFYWKGFVVEDKDP